VQAAVSLRLSKRGDELPTYYTYSRKEARERVPPQKGNNKIFIIFFFLKRTQELSLIENSENKNEREERRG
jgi:hypothetical protein